MLTRALLIFLPLLLTLGGCSRPADISKPKHYHGADIGFDYPGNWKITKDNPLSGARFILIKEPGHAVVAVTVYPPGVAVDLQAYADAFSKNMTDAIPFKTTKNPSPSTTENQIDYKFSIGLGSVSVPHTANLTLHSVGQCQVICLTQVVDEKRSLVAPGFDLIRRTLSPATPKSESTAP